MAQDFRELAIDGEMVRIYANGAVNVQSKSNPDTWWLVTPQFCKCPGWQNRSRCRHKDLFARYNSRGWPETPEGLVAPEELTVWTSRYQNGGPITRSGLVPVRITLGAPKMRLPYDLEAEIRELAPDRWTFHIDDRAEFEPKFRAKLDKLGADYVRARLETVSALHGGRGLVLLCFEDVTKMGEWCHRQIVAAWIEENLRIPCKELPTLATTPRLPTMLVPWLTMMRRH